MPYGIKPQKLIQIEIRAFEARLIAKTSRSENHQIRFLQTHIRHGRFKTCRPSPWLPKHNGVLSLEKQLSVSMGR